MKHLMRFNLGLGLRPTISPFVLALLNQRMFRLLWEDFVLGFGIATFSLWRLWSRAGAAFADFMMMTLGLTTLLILSCTTTLTSKLQLGTIWR